MSDAQLRQSLKAALSREQEANREWSKAAKKWKMERDELIALVEPVIRAKVVAPYINLIVHCWVHSGYENCGYKQMTTKQKEFYDSVIALVQEEY